MKSKFIFIYEPCVHQGLQVHHVMIGISERDKRAAERIRLCAAKNKDVFFKKYDNEVCTFIRKLACQIYPQLSPDAAKAKLFIFNEKFETTPQECLSMLKPSIQPNNVKNLM